MKRVIRFIDERTGGSKHVADTMQLPDGSFTVRELIEYRVQREVSVFNASPNEIFNGLVQPVDSEVELNGYRLKPDRKVDWEKQFELAVAAFENKGFVLLINDRQVTDLNHVVEVRLDTDLDVTFLKLVPLVGG